MDDKLAPVLSADAMPSLLAAANNAARTGQGIRKQHSSENLGRGIPDAPVDCYESGSTWADEVFWQFSRVKAPTNLAQVIEQYANRSPIDKIATPDALADLFTELIARRKVIDKFEHKHPMYKLPKVASAWSAYENTTVVMSRATALVTVSRFFFKGGASFVFSPEESCKLKTLSLLVYFVASLQLFSDNPEFANEALIYVRSEAPRMRVLKAKQGPPPVIIQAGQRDTIFDTQRIVDLPDSVDPGCTPIALISCNKYVGGHCWASGIQEEELFCIQRPELLVMSMLSTHHLTVTEALSVVGPVRFLATETRDGHEIPLLAPQGHDYWEWLHSELTMMRRGYYIVDQTEFLTRNWMAAIADPSDVSGSGVSTRRSFHPNAVAPHSLKVFTAFRPLVSQCGALTAQQLLVYGASPIVIQSSLPSARSSQRDSLSSLDSDDEETDGPQESSSELEPIFSTTCCIGAWGCDCGGDPAARILQQILGLWILSFAGVNGGQMTTGLLFTSALRGHEAILKRLFSVLGALEVASEPHGWFGQQATTALTVINDMWPSIYAQAKKADPNESDFASAFLGSFLTELGYCTDAELTKQQQIDVERATYVTKKRHRHSHHHS